MTLFIRVLITEPQCHLLQPCYVCLMHHSRMVSTGSRWMPLYRFKVMVCQQQSFSSRWLSSLLGQLAIKRGATSVFCPRAGAYVRKWHKTHRHAQLYFLDQISTLPEWLSSSSLRDELTSFWMHRVPRRENKADGTLQTACPSLD